MSYTPVINWQLPPHILSFMLLLFGLLWYNIIIIWIKKLHGYIKRTNQNSKMDLWFCNAFKGIVHPQIKILSCRLRYRWLSFFRQIQKKILRKIINLCKEFNASEWLPLCWRLKIQYPYDPSGWVNVFGKQNNRCVCKKILLFFLLFKSLLPVYCHTSVHAREVVIHHFPKNLS